MPPTLTMKPKMPAMDPSAKLMDDTGPITSTRSSGPSVAVAGAGGDPPKRPNGSGLPNGHYLDVDQTGRLPVKQLNLKMASTTPPSRFIDPATKSERSDATRYLALRQNSAARNLLYNPGPTVRQELSLAAGRLHTIMGQLDVQDQRTLGTRLLGAEGMLAGQGPDAILATLDRVAREFDGGNPTANDRAVVLALMGDIGALYADTGATTGVQGRTELAATRLRDNLGNIAEASGLQAVRREDIQRVQRLGGSGAVGPTKKQERKRPENDKPPRSGIHNLGFQADVDLGTDGPTELTPTRWDVATIRKDRVDESAEPLVGHMSGSPAEILQVFDFLRGVGRDGQYTQVMDQQRALPTLNPMLAQLTPAANEARHARAAAAGAFLVGMGYHSAVEVAEGILAYTGQDARGSLSSPRRDAVELLGQGAATDLLTDMFDGYAMPRDEPEM